jgi:TRAP-type uncharacterized transport system substrate-binding protein
VWVFYRGEQRVDKLHQLAGRRVAVGEEGSGIRGLALQLLEANDIKPDSPDLLPLAGLTAAEALQQSRSTRPSSSPLRKRRSCRSCCVRRDCGWSA